jgi:hypothetical protein
MKSFLITLFSFVSTICYCQQENVIISTSDIGVQQMMLNEKNRKDKLVYNAYAELKFKKDTSTILLSVNITGLETDSVFQLPEIYRSLKFEGLSFNLNFEDPSTKEWKNGKKKISYNEEELKKYINISNVIVSNKEVLEKRPGGTQAMHTTNITQFSYLTSEKKFLDCTISTIPSGTSAEVYLLTQQLWNEVYKIEPPLQESAIKVNFLKYIKKRRIGNTLKTISIPLADEPYYIIFEYNGGFLGNVLDPADSKDHSFTFLLK